MNFGRAIVQSIAVPMFCIGKEEFREYQSCNLGEYILLVLLCDRKGISLFCLTSNITPMKTLNEHLMCAGS